MSTSPRPRPVNAPPDRLLDGSDLALPGVEQVHALPPEVLPAVALQLAALQAAVAARLVTPAASHNANGADAKPYTLTDAAGLLDKSTAWLRRRARAGRVPGARKVGRSWMFERAAFDRWRCRSEVS